MEPDINRLHPVLKNKFLIPVEPHTNSFAGSLGRGLNWRFGLGSILRLDLIQNMAAALMAHPAFENRLSTGLTRILDVKISRDPAFLDHLQDGFLRDSGRLMHVGYRGVAIVPQIFCHQFFIFFFDSVAVRTKSRRILYEKFAAFLAICQSHAIPSFRLHYL